MKDYITHQPIFEELKFKHPQKSWNERYVYRWCQQVETIYIADPDAMWKYYEIPLKVIAGKVYLPDNLYKLLDVFDYSDGSHGANIRFNRQGRVIKQLLNYDKDTIWINYIGTPIDDDCMPLIKEQHYPACETFCKLQGFEYDAIYGKMNVSMYANWQQRFDGMIQAVKSDIRDWSSQEWADMTIIHGNEIPKIGYMPLANDLLKM